MTEKDNLLELEEMRGQLQELKNMLKEQTIVNERMMRKAMKGKYNKVRNSIKSSIIMAFIAMPLMGVMLPMLGMPLWFTAVTVAFILSALIASVFSLRRYASEDLMTGNLTSVAIRLIRYKRFGIYWFLYAIPFLVVWILLFFRFVSEGRESEFADGAAIGGAIGGVIGLVIGVVIYVQDLRHMNSIIREIRSLKRGA